MQKESKVERVAYSVPEMAEAIGISNRTAWEYVKDGSIAHFRLGTRVLIPKEALQQFIQGRAQAAVKPAE